MVIRPSPTMRDLMALYRFARDTMLTQVQLAGDPHPTMPHALWRGARCRAAEQPICRSFDVRGNGRAPFAHFVHVAGLLEVQLAVPWLVEALGRQDAQIVV